MEEHAYGRLSEEHLSAARAALSVHGVVVLRRALPLQTVHAAFSALRRPCRINYDQHVEVCDPSDRPTSDAPLWRRLLEAPEPLFDDSSPSIVIFVSFV